MRLNICSLFNNKDLVLPFSFSESIKNEIDFLGACELLSPVSLLGEVTKTDDIYEVRGKGSVICEVPCGRCLKPTRVEVSFELDDLFSNDDEKNDEETETFIGDFIDLDQAVARSILACLPMKALCKEDCKGLCQQCGIDLNLDSCSCDTTYSDPRFEGLRSLLKFDEEV